MKAHCLFYQSTLIASILLVASCGGDTLTQTEQEPDPVVVDIPIVFVKRALPLDEDGNILSRDLTQTSDFVPGAALFMKARASASAPEINITDRAFLDAELSAEEQAEMELLYDVKDLDVSPDGDRVIFAMRAPEIEDADDDEQPTWNIWEYDLPNDTLRRVITSDIAAESGQDIAPAYLPDGRIVFSSTRQRANQAILLDEGKPQYIALEERLREPASVLHVMDSDGTDITQISFNQSHDYDPTVLNNGKILFSRWDQAAGSKGIHFYQMNPDGSELEVVYGRHSHDPQLQGAEAGDDQPDIQFLTPRETSDGTILTALRAFGQDTIGGNFVNIDINGFSDINQPLATNAGGQGEAQVSALFDNVEVDGSLSLGGYFQSLYPLSDGSGRLLFTWSQCRVFDPDQEVDTSSNTDEATRRVLPCTEELIARDDIEATRPLFSLWIFDPVENTQRTLAVPQEGIAYTEVVAMEPGTVPANAQTPEQFVPELVADNLGIMHIRSVYDFAGEDVSALGIAALSDPQQVTSDQRPARFLRIVKAVSIPDDDVRDFDGSAFGRSRNQLMREVIGYVPVEPDGSAKFQVPAQVPLAISVLDSNGRRIGERHQNWLQVGAGEVRTCNGCHTNESNAVHGRLGGELDSINLGAAVNGNPFPNTNPLLFADMGETMAETATRINGVPYPQPDISFEDIWTDPALRTPQANFEYAYADLMTALPITQSCAVNWTPVCRITLNFPDHIQPLFELDRRQFEADGVTLIEDQTCVSCHSPTDSDDQVQVPVAQLDLRSDPSNDENQQTVAYRELLFPDNEQEIVEGALVDRLVVVTDADGNIVFERDEDGELILDGEGNPIPVTQTVRVNNSLSPNGANASGQFLSLFMNGSSHAGWLSPAELKLISEWLDLGAQYYNNPFDAPAN
ncbi:hypothetical protein EYS14_23285 [Alteromonadaceae bacterium M269]|nr:hypothetical protein EYS14_23285 [Alteromonadaceae bacterium M269]